MTSASPKLSRTASAAGSTASPRSPRVSAHEDTHDADETTAIIGASRHPDRKYDTHARNHNASPANTLTTTSHEPSASSTTVEEPRRLPGLLRKRGQQSASRSNTTSQDHTEKMSVWQKMVDKYGALELENKASVARDHLALERTFLAWVRTALSFASIGIAVSQLFRLNVGLPDKPHPGLQRVHDLGRPLGSVFLGIGIVMLLFGFHRYFESQYYVVRGKFPASRGIILLVTFIAAALIITSFVVVLTLTPAVYDR